MSAPHAVRKILILCGLIVSLALGVRHSFGLYLPPVTLELGFSRESFALAIALQNLLWGFVQPFVGALADLWGARRVLIAGALTYVLGLVLMSLAATPLGFQFSGGAILGLALASTTYSVVFGLVGRVVSAEGRSRALGVVSAAGSIGQFLVLPFTQSTISQFGWSLSLMIAAGVIACLMFPAAWLLPDPKVPEQLHAADGQKVGQAIREAFSTQGFILLAFSYFVCGFQVTFVGTHLPAYLLDQGLAATLGTTSLALIGLFNVFGTYLFGVWGGARSKKMLLATIYGARAVVIALYIFLPISTISTLVFASVLGFLWLATVPLTTGLVAQIYGVRFMATLSGLVFCFHQIGSFVGVWLGGRIFDETGSYTTVWLISMALGVIAMLSCLPIREQALARQERAA